MNLGLEKSIVFIAGSSRGIGLAIAEAFLGEGACVAITGRNEKALGTAHQDLSDRYGKTHVLAICGDLTCEQGIEDALAQTELHFGGLHHVVANIGSGRGAMGWDIASHDWRSMMDVNFFSGAMLASSGARRLCQTGGGTVTFVSSIAGSDAKLAAPISYSAAKAAQQMTVKTLARELAVENIRVNAVSPGNVLFPGGMWAEKLDADKTGVEGYIKENVPLNRFASPKEIADAVLFLSSNRAGFMTGTIIEVDGGQSLS